MVVRLGVDQFGRWSDSDQPDWGRLGSAGMADQVPRPAAASADVRRRGGWRSAVGDRRRLALGGSHFYRRGAGMYIASHDEGFQLLSNHALKDTLRNSL